MLSQLALKVKRRETPFYSFIYGWAKYLQGFNLPTIKFIHLPLYYLHSMAQRTVRRGIQVFWSIPLFKARCERVGESLSLPNGIPLVIGNHLKIYLGSHVTIGRSTLGASWVFDEPILRIGSHSSIGYGTTISVAKEVVVGNHCMISDGCLIMDSDDHPISPHKRLMGLPVDKEDVGAVSIGDNVWIGACSAVLKGVHIGDNSVIAAHSVVTMDVEENSVYGGNPARLIRRIPLKETSG